MKILLSNDDGVYAPGINILAEALATIAEVIVVAPDRNRSGASNSLTLDNPLKAKQLPNGFYCVEGTPTDCVHMALTGFLDETPDMVIAGVNAGANLGDDVVYSGTVAAATEGRFLGLPAIAVSLVGDEFCHFQAAAQITKTLVQHLADQPLALSTILNVNIPDLPLDQIKGFAITRLGARHMAEHTIKDTDPRGNTIYWIGREGPEQDAGEGTDFCALRASKVSITPLKIDLTDYQSLGSLNNWMDLHGDSLTAHSGAGSASVSATAATTTTAASTASTTTVASTTSTGSPHEAAHPSDHQLP